MTFPPRITYKIASWFNTNPRRAAWQFSFVNTSSQTEDLLPNLFVLAKLPIFLLAQTINRRDADGLGGFDFWIRRYAPFDAECFLPFVRCRPTVKQPCRIRMGHIFKHRRRGDQADADGAQVIERRAFLHSRQQMMRVA